MKNFIIALEVSFLGNPAKIIADFDAIEQAEGYMLGIGGDVLLHETKDIIVLKRQDRNQWWVWDRNEPTQGWMPLEIPEVITARQQKDASVKHAQNLIKQAYRKEQIDPDEPTACVEAHLTAAYAAELRANATMIIAKAERVFLEMVLEAHGDIDWPT